MYICVLFHHWLTTISVSPSSTDYACRTHSQPIMFPMHLQRHVCISEVDISKFVTLSAYIQHVYTYAYDCCCRTASGTSRSPSVVLAAIMKSKNLSLDAALDILKTRAPHIQPNAGFIAQLELWAEMGYEVDEAHPGYKQFLLDQVCVIYIHKILGIYAM